jgi:hypothetical protein
MKVNYRGILHRNRIKTVRVSFGKST